MTGCLDGDHQWGPLPGLAIGERCLSCGMVRVRPELLEAKPSIHDEVARLRMEVASLRLTLGGRTFDNTVAEPVGCPCPGACSTVTEITRLRLALRCIANFQPSPTDECPPHSQIAAFARHTAREALK